MKWFIKLPLLSMLLVLGFAAWHGFDQIINLLYFESKIFEILESEKSLPIMCESGTKLVNDECVLLSEP